MWRHLTTSFPHRLKILVLLPEGGHSGRFYTPNRCGALPVKGIGLAAEEGWISVKTQIYIECLPILCPWYCQRPIEGLTTVQWTKPLESCQDLAIPIANITSGPSVSTTIKTSPPGATMPWSPVSVTLKVPSSFTV